MTVGTALINPEKIYQKINLTVGMRAADFGCGRTGHVVFSLVPKVGERGVVYALDIMKDVLESIKSQATAGGYENIHTVWTDVEKFGAAPIPENSIDAGFFINVMFMLKNRAEAMREAARLIKDKGYLVIVDWQKKIGPLGPSEEKMVNQDELIKIAQKEKFTLVDKIPLNEYHFCHIFNKE
jgi:ubiquinone/menaquinone biosynthesis C-methylase UbiE